MKIIAHRGEWSLENEKNSEKAFSRAIKNGFGVETDIRDYCGELVISHDVPQERGLLLENLFDLYNELSVNQDSQVLALNIKSDGISKQLIELINKHNINNYFVFDMSIPDTMGYIEKKIKTYSRISELEAESNLHLITDGVFLDQFYGTWYTPEYLEFLIKKYKRVCIVSSELHGFPEFECWNVLAKLSAEVRNNIILCTDFPKKSMEFFHDKE